MEVRENQCYLKCTLNPSAPGCGDYEAWCSGRGVTETKNPECYSGGNAICADLPSMIEALCNSVEGSAASCCRSAHHFTWL